jgi:hypothetical protein
MNRNRVYWMVVSLSFVLACGFLMQGVYGYNIPNQKCFTLTITPKQCKTTGASFCNGLSGCPGKSCGYCDSITALPNSICAASEGDQCPYGGQPAVICCKSCNLMTGTCAMPEGSGCTCANPKMTDVCNTDKLNNGYFPC